MKPVILEPVVPGTIGAKACNKCGMWYMLDEAFSSVYNPKYPSLRRPTCKECLRKPPVPAEDYYEVWCCGPTSGVQVQLIRRIKLEDAVQDAVRGYLKQGVRSGWAFMVVFKGKRVFEFNDSNIMI